MTENVTPWRPRWWYFGVFAVLAGVHLSQGWTEEVAIGLPVGFVATVVLVFVRRLPGWVTGEWSSRPWSRSWFRARRVWLSCALLVSWVPAALVVVAMVENPPHGMDVLFAGFGLLCAVALVVFVLVRWSRVRSTLRSLARPRTVLPVRVTEVERPFGDEPVPFLAGTVTFPDGAPGYFALRDCPSPLLSEIERTGRLWVDAARPGAVVAGMADGDDFAYGSLAFEQLGAGVPRAVSRAAVGKRLRRRTFALWVVLVSGVALEVAVFATADGALPWVSLVLVVLAAVVVVCWRGQVSYLARLLAAGPWTEVSAAVVEEDVWLGRPVRGWAVLPGGIRARFMIEECPPEVAIELVARRRLWTAGEPGEGEFAVGLPGGDTFAIGVFTVKLREYRRNLGPEISAGVPGPRS